jgi:hypothetical protein
MHSNKKLCQIFLGKCTGAPTKILTTKKSPCVLQRGGFFVWLIIQLYFRLLALESQLAVLQFALGLAL